MSPLAAARTAQAVTIGWMLIEGAVAIGAGIAARSVALTGFGLDSAIELWSSVIVLHGLFDRPARERRAAGLAGYALYALIAYIVLAAAASLLFRVEADRSPAGIALTAIAIPVMAVLWRWRLRLAERLQSPALHADAACSVVCLYLSAVTLAGLLLNQLFGLWWADSLAGLALIWWIRGEAAEAREASAGA
jgi:divalent metal cation (Fe/Co/Zn/Cd) transporter